MMKSKLLILSTLAISLVGCKSEGCINTTSDMNLVTPRFVVSQSDSQFIGALLVYPCTVGTTNYFGNYSGKPVIERTEPGNYVIGKTGYLVEYPPVTLPLGTYTMLYWGVPYNPEQSDERPTVVNATIGIGQNLMDQKLSLVSRNDSQNTYAPTYDYVYATKNVDVTNGDISVALRRVVSGLKVVVANKNGTSLSSKVVSITASIGGIAESLNFFTASPENMTKTVSFPLTISSNRDTAFNSTIMIFPSSPKPLLTVYFTLDNGDVKVFTSNLSSSLVANNKVTILVNLSEIVVTPSGGGEFTVEDWNESNVVIDTGIID